MNAMNQTYRKVSAGSRGVMVAVVLGTALTALGPTAAQAAQPGVDAVSDLSRYCTACWRNARLHPDCWTDCTQDVFARLMERVAPEAWNRVLKTEGSERQEFLRAIDTVKKRSQRSRKYASLAALDVADHRDRGDIAADREAVRQASATLLSPRQQKVLQLIIEGWAVQDIARELNIPAERVSDEKYKAIRKLRDCLGKSEQG